MNTLADTAKEVLVKDGFVAIHMAGGAEFRFRAAENPRLARGTEKQLKNIELSPFGVHWPDLDEDLSFKGLAEGNFGQRQK